MIITKHLFNLLLKCHYNALFTRLDAVQLKERGTEMTQNGSKNALHINAHFLSPLIVNFLTMFIGYYALEYEALGTLPNLFEGEIPHSQYVVFHQTLPPNIWSQSDGLVLVTVPGAITMFFVLLFNRFTPPQLTFYHDPASDCLYISNQKGSSLRQYLSAELSQKLIRFQKLAQLFLHLTVGGAFFVVQTYLYLMLFVNGFYNTSVLSLSFFSTLLPVFIFYEVYANFAPTIYVLIYSRYLLLLQSNELDAFQDLKEKLTTTSVAKNRKSSITSGKRLYAHWLHYLHLNEKILFICRLTTEYARVWRSYLSVLLPSYVLTVSYLILSISKGSMLFLENFMFIFISGQLFLFIYGITGQCARILVLYGRISRANLALFAPFQAALRRQKFSEGASAQKLLKVRVKSLWRFF